jgi:hypothetical protein
MAKYILSQHDIDGNIRKYGHHYAHTHTHAHTFHSDILPVVDSTPALADVLYKGLL